MNGASDDTRTMMSASSCSAARAKRASTSSSGPRTTVMPCAAPNSTMASSQRIGGGGDGDVLDQARRFQAMDDVPEQRLAGDGLQHLARQARRAHARLDHRDDAQMLAVVLMPLRLYRWRGCGAAGACRRRDRRASRGRTIRKACGPLKPSPSATKLSRMRAITGAISSGSQQWPAAYSAPLPSRSRWNSTAACAPAMHRALDHRRPARVIGPAGRADRWRRGCAAMAERLASRRRRGIGGDAMQQGDVVRAGRVSALRRRL